MKVVAQVLVAVVAAAAVVGADPDGSYYLDSRGVHFQLGLTPPRQLLETHRAATDLRTHSGAAEAAAAAAGVYSAGLAKPRDPNPQYAWAYEVAAPSSGDRKAAREERRGDLVVGQYSVVDPDGSLRVVDYFVKPETGFHVTINKDAEATAQQATVQYSGAGQPDVSPPHRHEQAATDPFQDPQFRSQSPQVTQDVFKKPQTSPQVTDHFKSPQFRDQIQSSQMKDQFQSPQLRDQFPSPQLKDHVQSPQVTDHFRIPQFKDQFQRPQARDPTQSPQFRHQPQSPRLQDPFTRPQFKELADLFQSPQFGRERLQRPQIGQPFQLPQLQSHQLGGQFMGQPFTEFQFQHPHFSKHHILNPQLRSQPFFDVFHFSPLFKPIMSPQTAARFQSPLFKMQHLLSPQQATGSPFSHPTFRKHQFLNHRFGQGQFRSQQSDRDPTRSEQTKEQIHSQRVSGDQLRSDPTKGDQFPGQGADKDSFQDQQAQQEQLKKQQAHADGPQDQQDKKDQLHQQAQGSSDLFRNQEFIRDQAQKQQFSEGVFQKPQSRFQHEISRDFQSMNQEQQQRQQLHQLSDQQASRSPDTLNSVPGSGVTLKTSLSNLDSQRPTQSFGRPLHIAAAAAATQTQDMNVPVSSRAREFRPVQTHPEPRPEERPEARPRPDPSPVVSTLN